MPGKFLCEIWRNMVLEAVITAVWFLSILKAPLEDKGVPKWNPTLQVDFFDLPNFSIFILLKFFSKHKNLLSSGVKNVLPFSFYIKW